MSSTLHHQGTDTKLNITGATVVKANQGRIVRIVVNTAGSTAGSVWDAVSTAGNGAANLIFSIPNVVGIYFLDIPVFAGIVITPGTAQVLSVSFT
jgi:hypothetical protein